MEKFTHDEISLIDHEYFRKYKFSKQLEPMFKNLSLLGREKFISAENISKYKTGLCPVAEKITPRLLQFKTNVATQSA